MHHRIGFVVGAVTLSLVVVAGPVLAAPGSGAVAPEQAHTVNSAAAPEGAQGTASAQVSQTAALPQERSSRSRPLIAVSHRGASGYAPENTLAAIDEAHRFGAETVEVDVQLTADGQLVLMHDTTLGRTTDVAKIFPDRAPYRVGDFTLEEIRRLDAGSSFSGQFAGEPVPLLREALDRLEGFDMNLFLEVKEPSLYPGIERQIAVELTRRPYWLTPNRPHEPLRLIVQSFDWHSTEVSKGLLPSIPHALLGRVPEDRIAEFDWAHMINPNHNSIDSAYVGEIHAAGLEIMPYTINDPKVMRDVLEMGVDGFITDFPDVGQKAIADFLRDSNSALAREHESQDQSTREEVPEEEAARELVAG